jgi:hypothetical protein
LNGEGLDKSDGHWQTLVQEVFQRPLISRGSGYWLSVHDRSGRLCFVYVSLCSQNNQRSCLTETLQMTAFPVVPHQV